MPHLRELELCQGISFQHIPCTMLSCSMTTRKNSGVISPPQLFPFDPFNLPFKEEPRLELPHRHF